MQQTCTCPGTVSPSTVSTRPGAFRVAARRYLLALRRTCASRRKEAPLSPGRSRFTTLRATAAQLQAEEAVEEDFYSLLGVSPFADTREIKRAYYGMMRTCHPDRSGDSEANDFCALLNEVYETLTDPTRRALYDELAGFSADSVNPFLDDRYPRDRVFVDEFSCIGCRNCNNVCPKTFGMEEEYGRARAMQQDVDSEAKLQVAIDSCPVSCIHWVTSPQLSLLETAMARMERLPVWTMMSGAGANKDVFTEASLAWTRRQSEIRRRVDAAVPDPTITGWSFWNNTVSFESATGSRFYQDTSQARQRSGQRAGAGSDRESRGIADLAARAARAARTWRRFQEVATASPRERMVISATSSASSMDD